MTFFYSKFILNYHQKISITLKYYIDSFTVNYGKCQFHVSELLFLVLPIYCFATYTIVLLLNS